MKNNFSNIIICLILFLVNPLLYAQEGRLRYELTFTSDNDSYVLKRSDRYYTNGLSGGFLLRLSNKPSASNSLEFNIQHHMYSGVAVEKDNKKYWDRPFSGVLSFQSVFRHSISANRRIALRLNLEQVGPKASAGEIQNFFHQVFSFYEVDGWENQLPNSFGADIGVNYLEDFYANHHFSIGTEMDAVVGMNNTNFQIGLPIRLGKIKRIYQSVFSKSSVNTNELNDEFFVFYQPSFTYQVKNSSIRNWDLMEFKHPDNAIQPYIFTQHFGATLARRKTALTLSFIRNTSEMKAMKYKYHMFGRIQLSRRF